MSSNEDTSDFCSADKAWYVARRPDEYAPAAGFHVPRCRGVVELVRPGS